MKKIGIMTCGGDCSGLNALIYGIYRACKVHNINLVGVFQNSLNMQPFESKEINFLDYSIINQGGSILGTVVESDLLKHEPKRMENYESIFCNFAKKLKLDCLILIAGDGGITFMKDFCEAINLPVIAIPKTIDNDIPYTDFSIGFSSVIENVTKHIDALCTTTMSHKRIMIIETMGRSAGFIALYTGIATCADVILVPENPYHEKDLLEFIEKRYFESNNGVLIVISEAVRNTKGDHIYLKHAGPLKRYGGICEHLSYIIEAKLSLPVRNIRLGHLQRGGNPSAQDRFLAFLMADKAIELYLGKKFNNIICCVNNKITTVPIKKVKERGIHNIKDWVKKVKNLGIYMGIK